MSFVPVGTNAPRGDCALNSALKPEMNPRRNSRRAGYCRIAPEAAADGRGEREGVRVAGLVETGNVPGWPRSWPPAITIELVRGSVSGRSVHQLALCTN